MIKYNKKGLKSLIICYNNKYYFSDEYIYFQMAVRRCNSISVMSKISNSTKLLFINVKNNTIIRVDYYRLRYFNFNDSSSLDPNLDYLIEVHGNKYF